MQAVKEGGQRSTATLNEPLQALSPWLSMLSNQQGGQSDVESAVEYSTIDLEWIIIELIHLLDRDFPSGSTLAKEVLSLACESKRTLLHLSAARGFHELLKEIIQNEVD